MRFLCFITTILFIVLIAGTPSCTKAPPPPPTPPDSIPDTTHNIPDFTVNNEWQCDVDGIAYSGTIDTSFTQIEDSTDFYSDTLITCVGTSYDKKANILFAFFKTPEHDVRSFVDVTLFDTVSPELLIASYDNGQNSGTGINYTIDSFRYDKVKAHFSGYLYSGFPVVKHKISNGKLSCNFNKGNNEPDKFFYNMNLGDVTGYFNSALLVSNTLILDGQLYSSQGTSNIRLQVRTGEDIKPGVYKSTEGNAAFYYHIPDIDRQYVDGETGDLTVTINSADNGIIIGSFSGTDYTGTPINDGSFKCRIKNYAHITDSVNQWKFNALYNFQDYRMYGGNVMKSTLTQKNGRYILTIKGNSDFGASTFKLQLSSATPISAGNYTFPNGIDSLYFSSNEKILNGGNIYISESGEFNKTVVTINNIDSHNVSGMIVGSHQGVPEPGIETGSFTGSFY